MLPFTARARITPEALLRSRDPDQRLEALLAFACFAPSVHNSQPWRVLAHSPYQCTIFLEKRISLPRADPTGRGSYLALGAFVENFAQAAACIGLELETTRTIAGDVYAINATLTPNAREPKAAAHEVLSVIRRRQTDRGIFRPLPDIPAVIHALHTDASAAHAALTFLHEPSQLAGLAELIGEGTRLAYSDRAFCSEHADWVRPNWTFREDGIPGYAIGINTPLSFLVPHAIRRKDLSSMRTTQELTKARSANLFAVLGAAPDTHEGWVEAGRRLERCLLAATRLGIAQSPNAAPIEMGHLQKEVQKLAGVEASPVLVIRFGLRTTDPPRPTPRRPVGSFLAWAT